MTTTYLRIGKIEFNFLLFEGLMDSGLWIGVRGVERASNWNSSHVELTAWDSSGDSPSGIWNRLDFGMQWIRLLLGSCPFPIMFGLAWLSNYFATPKVIQKVCRGDRENTV
jgi:hypothetical protein